MDLFTQGFMKEAAYAARIYRLIGKAAKTSGAEQEALLAKIQLKSRLHAASLSNRPSRSAAETLRAAGRSTPQVEPVFPRAAEGAAQKGTATKNSTTAKSAPTPSTLRKLWERYKRPAALTAGVGSLGFASGRLSEN